VCHENALLTWQHCCSSAHMHQLVEAKGRLLVHRVL
jgi:hypothetical protein